MMHLVETEKEKNEKPEIIEENFARKIEKNRKVIVGISCGVLSLAVLLTAFFFVRHILNTNRTEKLEALITRYDEQKSKINDSGTIDADVETLTKDFVSFAEKAGTGYDAAKAYSALSAIYAAQKKWAESEAASLDAAKKGAKTYLAPVELYNAGVAAEEQNKTDAAIEHYTASLAFADFPQAGRAQFAVGRLNEAKGDKDAAKKAYQNVIDTYSADEAWTNLAHSRLIALEVEGAAK